MLRSLLAALALGFLLAACDSGGTVGGISPGDTSAIRLRHVDAVNAARAQVGAQPVRLSAELNAAAETHARDMSVQGRAWHFGSDSTGNWLGGFVFMLRSEPVSAAQIIDSPEFRQHNRLRIRRGENYGPSQVRRT
jgi:hypothetical protein